MDELITKYAILNKQTDLSLYNRIEDNTEHRNSDLTSVSLGPGTLIKMLKSNSTIKDTNSSCMVQVLDYNESNPMWENLYECQQSHLEKVHEDLWPFVISIKTPNRRLHLVQNLDQCKQIIYLKTNDFVKVSSEQFGQHGSGYDCIVRYIGPVQELSKAGYYFGLELLNLDNGYSPQSANIPFALTYLDSDPKLTIFTTADWITAHVGLESRSKFPARGVLNEAIDKARTAIKNCTNGVNKPAVKRTESKNTSNKITATRIPTAKFYDIPSNSEYCSSTDQTANRIKMIKTDSGEIKSQHSSGFEKGKARLQSDRESNHIMKDAFNSNDLIKNESEDFKQTIENYERNLERIHSAAIPNAPVSILKRRLAPKEGNPKPVTIMSLDDRDIVVIDKADIKESTLNEGNVIVIDKQPTQSNEVDLVDLLGENWPNNAGGTAMVLNKSKLEYQSEQKQICSSISNGTQSFSNVDKNKSSNHIYKDITGDLHLKEASEKNASLEAKHKIMSNGARDSSLKYTNVISTPVYDNVVHSDENAISVGKTTKSTEIHEDAHKQDISLNGLSVGSMVEISVPEVKEELYGVIRWIGVPPEGKTIKLGVELEDNQNDKELATSDGSYNGITLFKCHEGRSLFVYPSQCSKDRRFIDIDTNNSKVSYKQPDTTMFGQIECPPVPGTVPPLKVLNLEELEDICGKFKGIQGHHNSCYLDATLFSMFTFTHVFDSILFRSSEADDISNYKEVQKVLREEIVNPLRKNVFVRADRVMKLRQLLDKLSSVSGLTSEEKDPEEFLNSLLAQIMRTEPFLKLSSGQDAYFYQLFVEKDERLFFPSVQQLFEQSFHSSDIKLKEVPSCLIIQMPRFGKNFKMYPRILPSQVLDVTDIIEDSPRQCSVCGKLAEYECRECFGILQGGVGLESTSFCRKCLQTVHLHVKRANHKPKEISVPSDFKIIADHMTVPRIFMELFAVVCIETSHYVAFVKAGSGPDAPWCFFDSMADRKGEQNGYNIPEMITVPDLPLWLSEEGSRTVNETSSNDKMLPEHAKRLFCDAYMCMYQSTDVMMYR